MPGSPTQEQRPSRGLDLEASDRLWSQQVRTRGRCDEQRLHGGSQADRDIPGLWVDVCGRGPGMNPASDD